MRPYVDYRQQQAKSWELCAAMSTARLWRDQGKRDDARALPTLLTRMHELMVRAGAM